MHLKIVFKWALHYTTVAIKHFNSGTKLFQAVCNTTSQSFFKRFATHITQILLKLKHFALV